MEQRPIIDNMKAEMLLSYLYPELAKSWRVKSRGNFYRNYSEDIISYNLDDDTVELSRDGLMKLLPPRMVSDDNHHGNIKEHSQKESEEIRVLSELFMPLDSILFRLNISIEQNVSELLNGYETYIVKEYFGYDIATIENKYLKMFLPLLPYSMQLKVNYPAISTLMSTIIGHNVSFKLDSYSKSNRAEVVLLRVTFIIDVAGLNIEEFQELNESLTPLFSTIKEWLIPFDQISEFRVRDITSQYSKVNEVDILSYNTRIAR